MSSIRKCKACNRAVKGHPGPYGMAKCKNVPITEDEVNEDGVESAKTVEMEVAHEYDKDDNIEKTEAAVGNVVRNLSKQKQVLEQVQSAEAPVVEDDANNSIVEHSMNDVPPEEASKNEMESSEEDNDESHFLDEVIEDKSADKNKMQIDEPDPKTDLSRAESEDNDDSKTNDEKPNKTTDEDNNEEDEESTTNYEIPDCSLGEVSLNFGAKASEEERKRLFSQSDSNVDIRNLILGRAFVLCFCDNFDCECEGEVQFAESLKGQVGVVENLYIDPRDESDVDLEPKLSFAKTGWKAKEPNCIKFKLGGVSTPGVISSSGEVTLTANRVVEMVKGRKELSTVITGKMGLSLKLGEEFTEAGFRSPMKFKDLECNLFMIEEEGEEGTEPAV